MFGRKVIGHCNPDGYLARQFDERTAGRILGVMRDQKRRLRGARLPTKAGSRRDVAYEAALAREMERCRRKRMYGDEASVELAERRLSVARFSY